MKTSAEGPLLELGAELLASGEVEAQVGAGVGLLERGLELGAGLAQRGRGEDDDIALADCRFCVQGPAGTGRSQPRGKTRQCVAAEGALLAAHSHVSFAFPSSAPKGAGKRRHRRLAERVHLPALGNVATLEDEHLAAQHPRVLGLVRDDERWNVKTAQVLGEEVAKADPGGRVERRQRLVEQQRPGLHRQRPSQGHPLALPREAHRHAVRHRRCAHLRERTLHPGGPLGGPRPEKAETDVVTHREVGKESRILRHVRDVAVFQERVDVRGGVEEDVAVEHQPSGGGAHGSQHREEERRLPGAVRPGDEQGPRAHREVHREAECTSAELKARVEHPRLRESFVPGG